VRAIVSVKGVLIDESKICLVDQRGALQGMSRALPLEMVVRDLSQFLVDERNQCLKSLSISCSPSHEELAYELGGHGHKSLQWGELGKR
jgi:hypothetical protein